MHIWQQLYNRVTNGGKSISALAPMADVTDRAYRQMVATYSRMGEEDGGPDVLWTEFVSCDGLCSRGRNQLLRDLQYGQFEQKNLVAQIFGSKPENFTETGKLLVDLGYSAIDINMGCPDKTINNQGAGACMIKTPDIAVKCIEATRIGAPGTPLSVKTRIGWNSDESDIWIPRLLDTGIDALIVHARTRKELSDYPPHWDIMANIVLMAESYKIPVIANGGILSMNAGDEVCRQTGAHGFMIGKGSFGNPWLFSRARGDGELSITQRLSAAREHTLLYADLVARSFGLGEEINYFTFGDTKIDIGNEHVRGKSLNLMKKNFRCYINGFDGAKALREELMNASSVEEIVGIIDNALIDIMELRI